MNKKPGESKRARRVRLQEKIKEHITIDAEAGCRVWKLVPPDRYGHLTFDGDKIPAHRASWEAFHRAGPGSKWVLHKCDSPPWCNPEHLYLGDIDDNGRDHDIRIVRHGAMRNHLHLARLYISRKEWSMAVKHLNIFLGLHQPVDRWTDQVADSKAWIGKLTAWLEGLPTKRVKNDAS